MASVVITLTDEQEDGDGDVNLQLAFDPPLTKGSNTAAHQMANWVLLRLRQEFLTELIQVKGPAE